MKKPLVLRTAKAHQKQHESTLDTPPAMTIASGGQNSPPVNSNRGMKPATVVETMCRIAASANERNDSSGAAGDRRRPASVCGGTTAQYGRWDVPAAAIALPSRFRG